MENFFGLLKTELLYLQDFDSMEHFKAELIDYLDYYKRKLRSLLNNIQLAVAVKIEYVAEYTVHILLPSLFFIYYTTDFQAGKIHYLRLKYKKLDNSGQSCRDEVEEALILGDVDVLSVEQDEDLVVVYVSPSAFAQAKEVLSSLGISEYEEAEISMIPNEYITIDDEEVKGKFEDLIDTLDELEDVQNVYHNVDL